jgi:hypothetical protein
VSRSLKKPARRSLKKPTMVAHRCTWTYWGGAATCKHGYELLPDGTTRKMAAARWKKHRAKID